MGIFGRQEHPKNLSIVEDFSRESIKHTMLKQETIFKAQLVELHRLYGVQKTMMSEMNTITTGSGVIFSTEKQQSMTMITGIKVSNQNTILYPKFDELPNSTGIDLDLSLSIGCGGENRN